MAFRGRGRGRGFGGRGGGSSHWNAKQEPFVLFPEIENLPDAKAVTEEISLVSWGIKLQMFWNSSPYNYDGVGEAAKKKKNTEEEWFCDKDAKNTKMKPPLRHFIKTSSEYVPAELAEGEAKARSVQKKVQWNPDADLQKFDHWEKLEQRFKAQEGKGKEDEDEEQDENIEEEEEEYSDDGDYNQNIDFDDDEDDYNMEDGGDDEPTY